MLWPTTLIHSLTAWLKGRLWTCRRSPVWIQLGTGCPAHWGRRPHSDHSTQGPGWPDLCASQTRATSLLAHEVLATVLFLKSPEPTRQYAHLTVSSLEMPSLRYCHHFLCLHGSALRLTPFPWTPFKLLLSYRLTSRLRGANAGVSAGLPGPGHWDLCSRMSGNQTV